MAHKNTIQIARGNSLNHTSPRYGELFYDKNMETLLIGVPKDFSQIDVCEWRELTGNASIKGPLTQAIWATIKNTSKKGDMYIVTEDGISVVIKESVYYNENKSEANTNTHSYDNYLKLGQLILCIDSSIDISKIPNSFEEGPCKWIILNGDREAVDIAYFDSFLDNSLFFEGESKSVHNALHSLFTKKIHFKSSNGLKFSNTYENDETFINNGIGPFLENGEAIYVNHTFEYHTSGGEEKKISLNHIFIKSNGFYSIPLGNKNTSSIPISFTGNRNTTDTVKEVSSLSEVLEPINITSDANVTTVQQAIDTLHQTKADLNAQGKIPLHQIPKTLIGALQYTGSITYNNTAGKILLTNEELLNLLAEIKDPDSWENNSEGESATNTAFNLLDEGDYFIVNTIDITGIVQSAELDILKEQGFVDEEHSYALLLTNSDNSKVAVNNGDWIIIRKNDNVKITFDIINHSAAVDAINNVTGRVTIKGQDRNGLTEVEVVFDSTTKILKIKTDNALLSEHDIIDNSVIAGIGNKKVKSTELKVDDHTTEDSTILKTKTKDNVEVSTKTPAASGLMVSATEHHGDFIPCFNDDGTVKSSGIEYRGTKDNGNTVINGELNITPKQEENVFLYKKQFFTFDTEKFSSLEKRKAWTVNKKVLLDSESFVDGGEFDD